MTENKTTTQGKGSSTLSSLAKSQQSTNVGGAQSGMASSAGGSSVQAVNVVNNNEKLANDIGKMFGKTVEAHQDASEYAGKRVGADNLVEYKKEIDQIAAHYSDKEFLTSSDMAEKSRREQGMYEKYFQKGVFNENDLANQAFKDTYANPATDNLFGLKTQNRAMGMKLFTEEEKVEISNDIDTLGTNIDQNVIDVYKTRYKAVGLDPNQVDASVLDRLNSELATEVNNNYSQYYDEGGNLKADESNKMLDDMFKVYAGTDSAEIQASVEKSRKSADVFIKQKSNEQKQQYMNQATNVARAGTWRGEPYTDENGVRHEWTDSYKEFESLISSDFPLLDTENHTQVMNMYKHYTDSDNSGNDMASKYLKVTTDKWDPYLNESKVMTKTELDNNVAWANSIENNPDVSQTKKDSVQIKKEKLIREQGHITKVISDVDRLSTDDLRTLSETGTVDAERRVIPAKRYKQIISDRISKDSSEIKEMNIDSPEAMTEFRDKMNNVKRLSESQNVKTPSIFKWYDNKLQDFTGESLSLNEMKQVSEYVSYRADNGDESKKYFAADMKQLNQIMHNDAEDMTDELKLKDGNALMNKVASDVNREAASKARKDKFNDALGDMMNSGEWTSFTDLPTADNTSYHLQAIYKNHSNSKADIEKFVNGMETYDVESSWYSRDKMRLVVPVGMSNGSFKKSINTSLDVYNKGRNDKIGQGDLDYVIQNDGTNISYRLVRADNGEYLGSVSENGYQYIKGRE